LTSGIHTLDDREKQYWMSYIQAGNCYINRGITGAIVRRQPFGGTKESSFGPGAKAGGPNYVLQLMHAKQRTLPTEKAALNEIVQSLNRAVEKVKLADDLQQLWDASIGSYAFFWENYFSKQHDPSQVLGQDNILSYECQPQVLRIQKGDVDIDVLRLIAAALTCGVNCELRFSDDHVSFLLETLLQEEWCEQAKNLVIAIETERDLIDRIETGQIDRLRLLSPANTALKNVLADTACHAIIAPVLANGRIELLHFMREISLSSDYHRYGYLGAPII
jgi:RHH-type proline utilization regulon transcriptional repressor/proline dehydrogenase/delta 1-pyrroline-5-carboxylate dehydrogenase